MKQMKTLCALLAVLVFLVTLSACGSNITTYPFLQEQENVKKVEVCTFDEKTKARTPFWELSSEDAHSLVSELASMECHGYLPLDPILEYGDIVICITYTDGTGEMIGLLNTARIKADGGISRNIYWFDDRLMRGLILKYVDRGLLESVHGDYWSAENDQNYKYDA